MPCRRIFDLLHPRDSHPSRSQLGCLDILWPVVTCQSGWLLQERLLILSGGDCLCVKYRRYVRTRRPKLWVFYPSHEPDTCNKCDYAKWLLGSIGRSAMKDAIEYKQYNSRATQSMKTENRKHCRGRESDILRISVLLDMYSWSGRSR